MNTKELLEKLADALEHTNRDWCGQPEYEEYVPLVKKARERAQELDDQCDRLACEDT